MGGVTLMAKFFINANGDYFEALTDIEADIGTTEVTQRPSHLHAYSNGAWVAPSDAVYNEWKSIGVRAERDFLLASKVDKIVSNPLRWDDMSADEQAQWKLYRRALLDITAQAGFPNEVVWPQEP
jgi:hypothetical protein